MSGDIKFQEAPMLPRGCLSWVLTSPTGRVVECYDRRTVEKALAKGWTAKSTLEHLQSLNQPERTP